MANFSPFGKMPMPNMQQIQQMMKQNPFGQMMNQQPQLPQQAQSQQIPINHEQFKQFVPQLNQEMINQLITQARQQGISENDIQSGLNFLNQLNK